MDMVRHIKNQSDYSSLQRMILNKKINLKMKKVLFLLFVVVTTVVGISCNDHEEFFMDSVEIPEKVETNTVISKKMDADGWARVDESIKKRYRQGYVDARKGTGLNNLISLGFYTVYNATCKQNWKALDKVEKLKWFCDQHYYSFFVPYLEKEEFSFQNFKNNIIEFITNNNSPVLVHASTYKVPNNILVVWAVSDNYVRVTKISDGCPAFDFGNNKIIQLTWKELYDKAIEASDKNLANVGFIRKPEDNLM